MCLHVLNNSCAALSRAVARPHPPPRASVIIYTIMSIMILLLLLIIIIISYAIIIIIMIAIIIIIIIIAMIIVIVIIIIIIVIIIIIIPPKGAAGKLLVDFRREILEGEGIALIRGLRRPAAGVRGTFCRLCSHTRSNARPRAGRRSGDFTHRGAATCQSLRVLLAFEIDFCELQEDSHTPPFLYPPHPGPPHGPHAMGLPMGSILGSPMTRILGRPTRAPS